MDRNPGPSSSTSSAWKRSLTPSARAGASTMTEPRIHTAAELLTILSARELKNGQVVFAGVGIPLLAATLAQRLDCPGLTILFEGGVIGAFVEPGKLPPSTNDQRCTKRANMVLGSAEVLLLLQRGYVDVGFMGGARSTSSETSTRPSSAIRRSRRRAFRAPVGATTSRVSPR